MPRKPKAGVADPELAELRREIARMRRRAEEQYRRIVAEIEMYRTTERDPVLEHELDVGEEIDEGRPFPEELD